MKPPKIQDLRSKVLFITGPTASGKSDLAMRIAEEYSGEIICADSQTVRRDMNIGTAKPSMAERTKIRHHLLDIIDPYERFTVAEFVERAEAAIATIHSRGKLPIVVGGTGLYIDAVLYGFSFRPSSSAYSREDLESKSVNELQEIIKNCNFPMPKNTQNPRHLIRVIESEGATPHHHDLRAGSIVIGIDPGREQLQYRIEKRVDRMLADGFLQEFDHIVQKYGSPPHEFDAIEYRIVQQNRELNTEDLRQKLIIGDRQYAKKQRAWMKRNQDIVWFENAESAYEYIKKKMLIAVVKGKS